MTVAFDIETLVAEIALYLAAVDVFRREGCEPTWRPAVRKRRSRPRNGGRVAA